jgi:hypothetical protein
VGFRKLGLAWPSEIAMRLLVFKAQAECSLEGMGGAVMGSIQLVRIDVFESSRPIAAPDWQFGRQWPA